MDLSASLKDESGQNLAVHGVSVLDTDVLKALESPRRALRVHHLEIRQGFGLTVSAGQNLMTSCDLRVLEGRCSHRSLEDVEHWQQSLIQQLNFRASTYAKEGKTMESIYLYEQLYQIQSAAFHDSYKEVHELRAVGVPQPDEKLALLYERRGNYFQAERLFEKAVYLEAQKYSQGDILASETLPDEHVLHRYVSNLTRLYGLFKERARNMAFEYDDMDWAAAESILDRTARIDVDSLSISLYNAGSIPPAQSDSHEVLFSAAAYNACNLALLSLSREADVEGGQLYGERPLHSAINAGSMDMVKLLITKGADIESRDRIGETPLHRAVAQNSVEILNYLLFHNADIDARRKDRATVLMVACTTGLEAVRRLLEKGALVNLQDENGWTALHWATDSKKADVIEMLLRYNAVLDAWNNDEETALIQAAATPDASLETVGCLLANGAYVDRSDLMGRTAVQWAVIHHDQDLLGLLLDYHADMDAVTKDHETPLVQAARKNDRAIVRQLVERGAFVNSNDSGGRTAVHWAAEHENTDMLETLVRFDASVDDIDERGFTPLHIVASHWSYSTTTIGFISLLLDCGLEYFLPSSLDEKMPKAVKASRKLSFLKCHRCRLDKAKVSRPAMYLHLTGTHLTFIASVFLRIEYGLGLAVYDANATIILVQKAAQTPVVTLLNHLRANHPSPHPTMNSLERRTMSCTVTELGDLTWVKLSYWYRVEDILDDEDWERPSKRFCELMDALARRASEYGDEGKAQEAFYLFDQLHRAQLVASSKGLKESVIGCGSSSGKEVSRLYEARGNLFQAAVTLEESIIVMGFQADWLHHDQELLVSLMVDKLIQLYRLFKTRIERMDLDGFSVVLDRIARLDFTQLSTQAYNQGLLSSADLPDSEALITAASHDACNLARFLLEREANIDQDLAGGLAEPLHTAVSYNATAMIRLLLTSGANIEHRSGLGNRTPLHCAIGKRSVDIVMILLENGASVESRDNRHMTPLMAAAGMGIVEMVTMLLRKGANIHAKGERGWTALHYAANRSQIEVLKALLNHQASALAQTWSGETALHVVAAAASSIRSIQCVEILIKEGVEIDARDLQTETALHKACNAGQEQVVSFLLKKGASPHIESSLGTPLHLAIKILAGRHTIDVVQTLLEHGADPNIQRQLDGRTPLHIAAQQLHERGRGLGVLDVLCNFGASATILDNYSRSALDYAKTHCHGMKVLRDQPFITRT
ncbi:MAG: hypothetical protein Q9222_004299 [Ikaeria aurantiellina]